MEERRTQYLEKAFEKVRKLREQFADLNNQLSSNFVLSGLPLPSLTVWSDTEIEAQSKRVMESFASENNLEIVLIAADHAERAWRRYFENGIPFKREAERINRRKDIPDAWILETAIDLKERYPKLLALCDDARLSDALKSYEIGVFKDTQAILDEIEASVLEKPTGHPEPRQEPITPGDATAAAAAVAANDKLQALLAEAQAPFTNIDKTVLGYVAYLGLPRKDQLFELLSQAGVSVDIAKNVADRLVISGMIKDIGNHFLADQNEVSQLAANSVESEIIRALES
jgi:hypothetical protein